MTHAPAARTYDVTGDFQLHVLESQDNFQIKHIMLLLLLLSTPTKQSELAPFTTDGSTKL